MIVVLTAAEVGPADAIGRRSDVTVVRKIKVIEFIDLKFQRQLANIEVLVGYAGIAYPDLTISATPGVSENAPTPECPRLLSQLQPGRQD